MNIEDVKQTLRNNTDLVLDTGIYIEYFEPKKSELKTILNEILFTETAEILLYSHFLLKSELLYILCRKLGKNNAKTKVKGLEPFINFVSGDFLYNIAGEIKCKYPIALSDCFLISLSHLHECPVLFLEERELSEEVVKQINDEFKTQIQIISSH